MRLPPLSEHAVETFGTPAVVLGYEKIEGLF